MNAIYKINIVLQQFICDYWDLQNQQCGSNFAHFERYSHTKWPRFQATMENPIKPQQAVCVGDSCEHIAE